MQTVRAEIDRRAIDHHHDWEARARQDQKAPPGDWQFWLMLGGRGAGKTRTGAEWVRKKIKRGAKRFGLIAPTTADVRKVMVEGESGILAVCHDDDVDDDGKLMGVPEYVPTQRQLTWKNGATAVTYSAEEPNRLRGPQHDNIWADEVAAWGDGNPDNTWDMALFGLRLGTNPQALITTTPRPIPLLRELVTSANQPREGFQSPLCVVTRTKTSENKANLAPSFLRSIVAKYAGTRLGRQELEGEIIDEVEGALWTRAMIEASYMRGRPLPDLLRIVIGVDPAVTSKKVSALTGIIIAGLGVDYHAYVMADLSGRYSPGAWGKTVADAFDEYQVDRIIAEGNQGGDLVKHTIDTVRPNLPIRVIHASQAKQARAEPVASLYEQGKVHHVEPFAELEDQLLTWAPLEGAPSPDRLDALVWAIRELMLGSNIDNEDGNLGAIVAVPREQEAA